MDAIALLQRAHEAGLRLEPVGDKLMVRGPKRAEPVVRLLAAHKAEVLAVLAWSAPGAVEARHWAERLTALTFEWFGGKREWEEARQLAWGNLQNEWWARHGRCWPRWQCAGCRQPISGAAAIDLPDGNRVHLEPLDCLLRFGKRWRDDADAALAALFVEPTARASR